MLKTNFPHGDIKYYYQIHVKKQKEKWLNPVCYPSFYRRIRSWMTLHDAIYFPRVEYHVTKHRQNPIQDNLRRMKTLKENNIQILTFEEIEHLEQQLLTLNQKEEMANKYNFKPKPSLRIRFISFLKKRCK